MQSFSLQFINPFNPNYQTQLFHSHYELTPILMTVEARILPMMIAPNTHNNKQSIGSLTDEINRWLVSNTQGLDTKFRLINIEYASTAESIQNGSHVNYSALVVYEMVEIMKTDASSEPLDASGVE